MTELTPDVRAALLRTAEFFEAHPEKRTFVELARDEDEEAVSPWSPRATCFCAVGRLAVELHPQPPVDEGKEGLAAYDIVEASLPDADSIYWTNDGDKVGARTIALLRTLATEGTPA